MTVALEEIPDYLQQYIAKQDYDLYTSIDHASWRYIMRVSKAFFKDHAHPVYLDGLKATGITIDRIPRISEMDEKLKKFGWRAAVITGFIPPAVFLEFLSLGILPIACDMRRLENLEYTPSPDIVHEAAGHAPIIADPKYASYLHKFGEIARKVIFAKEDLDVYEAILHLSNIKEDPRTKPEAIEQAYDRLHKAQARVSYASEATQLSRVGWWSTEYGLVRTRGHRANGNATSSNGTVSSNNADQADYKIYGAGLLSSVGESYNCISDKVPKVPLKVDCAQVNFDITKQQPQLFYIDDFSDLEKVIEELSSAMAYRRGGLEGLEKAMKAGTVTTTELDSGLQMSGVVERVELDAKGQVAFLKLKGPAQLARQDCELDGHGADYHAHGYSTPLGLVRVPASAGPARASADAGSGAAISRAASQSLKSAADLTRDDLISMGFNPGEVGKLEFESGITVTGQLEGVLSAPSVPREQGGAKNLVMSFSNCTVKMSAKNGAETLYQPEWGPFDMACGTKVTSVFGGAADRAPYLKTTGGYGVKIKPQISNMTDENRDLIPLYADVRSIREGLTIGAGELSRLYRIHSTLKASYPQDWLLRLEMLEILANHRVGHDLQVSLRAELSRISKHSETVRVLIRRGLDLIQAD